MKNKFIQFTKNLKPAAGKAEREFASEAAIALEPRILLDAATIATTADTMAEAEAENQYEQQAQTTQDNNQAEQNEALLESLAIAPTANDRREVVFIDTSVNDYQSILAELGDNLEVVLLDRNSSGIDQIATALAGNQDIDALHIISHGNEGQLFLGTSELNANSMQTEHRDALLSIAASLGENADILIYGCDFGRGENGQAAANVLAQLTQADIAASDDTTGATEFDGDWQLEVNTGAIEAAAISSRYAGVLAVEASDGILIVEDAANSAAGTVSLTNNGEPTTVTSSGTPSRVSQMIDTVWTFNETADVGRASFVFDISGITGVSGTIGSDFGLIIGDNVSFTGDSLVLQASGYNSTTGQVFFHQVDVADGEFITLATQTEPDNFDLATSAIGEEDTAIDLGLVVNPALTDGGELPNIIGTDAGYRDAGTTAYTEFLIPAGATGVYFTVYSNLPNQLVSNNNSQFNEEFQITNISVDLSAETYSGSAFYVPQANDSLSDQYAWGGTTIGESVLTSSTSNIPNVGDFDDNTDFTIEVVDGKIRIYESQTRFQSAYMVEFTTATNSSAEFVGSATEVQQEGDETDIVLAITPDTDYIVLTEGATGADPSNFRIEWAGNSRIVIDLETLTATGVITARFGDGDDNVSAYGFTDYDVSSDTVGTIQNNSTITGDAAGSVRADYDPQIFLRDTNSDGEYDEIVIRRNPDALANHYTDSLDSLFAAEYYERVDVGSSGAFLELRYARDLLVSDAAGTERTLTLSVPESASLALVNISIVSAGQGDLNDNNGYAFAIVNLETGTTSGYFFTNRTQSPDLLGWSEVDFGDVMFDDPSTQSNRTSINQFVDQWGATAYFDVIDNGDGTRDLNFNTGFVDAGNNTYNDYYFAAAAQFFGTTPFEVAGFPTGGTFDRGGLNPDTGNWELTVEQAQSGLFFIPNEHFSGATPVEISIKIGEETESNLVTITAVIDPISFDVDTVTGDEDTSVNISTAVAPTFIDMDGSETLTEIVLSNIPEGHTVSDGSNNFTASAGNTSLDITGWDRNNLTYTAQDDEFGTFTIDLDAQWQDTGGGVTQTDTISDSFDVVINPVNDAPEVTNDNYITVQNTAIATAAAVDGILLNDSDPEGDTLTVNTTPVSGPSNGSLTLNSDGSFTYTPNAAYTGTDSFVYEVSDGNGGFTNGTVTIEVSEIPAGNLVAADDTDTTAEETSTIIDVTDNDELPTQGAITISGTTAPSNGSIVVNGDNTITYTPDTDFFGSDTFTYTLRDAGNRTSTATVTVNVTNVNDEPTALPDSANTTEDSSVAIDVLANDTDPDGDTLTVTIATSPDGSVVINGDNTITFTPTANFNGVTTITYTISDGNGETATSTVTVNVSPEPDAPTSSDNTVSTNEDEELVLPESFFAFADNDTGDSFRNLRIDTLPVNGELLFAGNPVTEGQVISRTDLINGSKLVFVPADNENGTGYASFDFSVGDGTLFSDSPNTLTIDVTPVDDAPITAGFERTTTLNTDYVFTLADFPYSDVEMAAIDAVRIDTIATDGELLLNGSAITVGTSVDAADITSGLLVFRPDTGESGDTYATFTFSVSDGGQFSITPETVTINVNVAPTADDDSVTGALTNNSATVDVVDGDTDGDGTIDPTTVVITSNPAGSTLAGDGKQLDVTGQGTWTVDAITGAITFTPEAGFTADPDAITYTVQDDDGATSNTATVTIDYAIQAPTASNDTYFAANLGDTVTEDLLANDSDPDGTLDTTSVVIIDPMVAGATLSPDGKTLTVTGEGTWTEDGAGNITFTPAPLAGDPTPITYTVADNDGNVSNQGTVRVDYPPFVPIANDDSVSDEALGPVTIDVLNNDSDGGSSASNANLDLATVQIVGTTNPGDSLAVTDQGTWSIDTDSMSTTYGQITFTPEAGFAADPDPIQYTVEDVFGGQSVPGTVTIDYIVPPVLDLNDDGTTADRDYSDTFTEGTAVNIVDAAASIIDGDDPTMASATVVLTNPQTNDELLVNGSNSASGSVNGISYTITDNGTDITISFTGSANNADYLTALNAITFNNTGDDPDTTNRSINITVNDGDNDSNTATTTIDIVVVNDPPSVSNTGITVDEGSSANVISNTELTATDGDNDSNELIYTVTAIPDNGTLLLNGAALAVNDTFTQADVDAGIVTYTHNGSETTEDSFDYSLTDGDAGTTPITDTFDIAITAINDIPELADSAVTTDEDTDYAFSILDFSYSDGENTSPQTFRIDSLPAAGTGTLLLNGSAITAGTIVTAAEIAGSKLIYRPPADENGANFTTFTVSASDGDDYNASPATVTISIDAVVDAMDDTATTDEDTAVITDVLNNDSFADPTAAVTSVTQGANGSVAINGDGTVTYTPDDDFNGNDSYTYTVTAGGVTETATVNVTVNAVADVVNDTATTDEDTAIVTDVLDNDSFADPTASVTNVAQGTNGTVVNNGDGTVTYTPDDDFNGTDSYTYTVTAGGVTETATVNVTINTVTDAMNDTATTDEDTAVTTDVLANDSFADPAAAVTGVTQGTNGTVVNNGDGTITYTPDDDFNGTDSYTYTVTAGGLTETATVNVTINAVADVMNDTETTDEDTAVTTNVLANDTFADPAAAVTSVTQGTNGTVVNNGDGTVTYTPDDDFNGTDSYTYTVTAGGVTETATVNITINAVADAMNDSETTDEDAAVTTNVLANDTFADPAAAVTSVTQGANGSVVINGDNTITYTPNDDFNGSDSYIYTVTTGGLTETATVNLTINSVNDDPVVSGPITTNNTEDDTSFSINLLQNANDVDGDTLTVSGLTETSGNDDSGASISGNSITIDPNSYNGLSAGESVGLIYTYDVIDGNGGTDTTSATITITGVNDTPTVDSTLANQTFNDNDTVSVATASGFTDVDTSNVFTYSASNLPTGLSIDSGSGEITGTIDALASTGGDSSNGVYTVTITATDSAGAPISQDVQWTISNATPIATDNSAAIFEDASTDATGNVITDDDGSGIDSDPDGDSLAMGTVEGTTISGSTSIAGSYGTLTIQTDGSYAYAITNSNATVQALAVSETITDTFSYTVNDGKTNSTTADLTVTIVGVNDAPDITAIIANQTNNDSDAVSLDVSGNFNEIDNGDSITFSANNLPTGLSINPSSGIITGTIDSSASTGGTSGLGDYSVEIIATDTEGAATSQTIAWQVNNIAPTAVDDSFTTDEDIALNDSVATNDNDTDGDTLSYALTSGAGNGTITLNSNGSFTYTPNLNFNGSDSFSYEVTDADGATNTATVNITVDAVNDAPTTIGVNDQSSSDSATISLDVSSAFSDLDGDTLTFSETDLPTGLSISSAGVISGAIDSSASVASPYNVSITANDGNGGTVTANLIWTVTNIAPEAFDNDDDVVEDTTTTASGNIITDTSSAGTDNDSDGDVITIDTVDGNAITAGGTTINGTYGDVVIASDGSYTYTLNNASAAVQGLTAGETVTDNFNYVLIDADGDTDTAILVITVTGSNDVPTAIDDSYATNEDTTLTVAAGASSLLGNDSDVDNDTLTVVTTPVTLPTNGTLTLNSDGSFEYIPDANFTGSDSFEYQIDDGNGGTTTATATITVNAENDTPELVAIIPDRSDQDGSLVNLDTSVFFTDVDGDTLTFTVSGLPSGLSIDSASGVISGQIAANASTIGGGNYSVTVTVTDPSGANIDDTFDWTIGNPGPVLDTAIPDRADQDSDDVSLDLSAFFTDPEGDTIVYSVSTLPAGLSLDSGTGIISGVLSATASVSSPYLVTVTADDQEGGITNDTFNWVVNNINPSVADPIEDQINFEGDAISIDATAAFANPDNDPLTYTVTGLPDGITFDNGTGLISGVIDSSAAGTYSITVTADDGTATATDVFSWRITNPAPILTTPEADRSDFEGAAVSIDASLNFVDPDGDTPLSYSATGLPAGITIDSGTGVISGTLTNDASNSGPYTVTVTVDDGEGGTTDDDFTWFVANIPPTADDLSLNLNEDGGVNGTLAPLAEDTDGDTLIFSVTSDVSNGTLTVATDGTFAYTPTANFFGIDQFTYQVDDGQGGTDTATVTLNIASVNDDPIANDDSYSTDEDTPLVITAGTGVLSNDTDVEMNTLAPIVTVNPSNGSVTLNNDGSFTYTPNLNFNGTDTFTYEIDDGNTGSDTATVTITVNPINDDPVATADTATTLEDQPLRIEPLTNDSDLDGDTLTISSANAPNGSVVINADGSISYTPNTNFNGTDTISYEISDGNGGTDTATITVTVTPVNDDPVALDNTATTNEDTLVNIDVLTNDSDLDGDTINVSSANAANGTVTIRGDGTLDYTPNANFNGSDTISYSISDGNGGTATASVTVTVNPVNDDPTGVADTAIATEDTPLTIDVLSNDSDVDGDTITLDTATALNGTVVINPDGTLTYTPDADFNGNDTITYTISDGNGGTDTVTVAVTVLSVNDSTTALNDFYTTNEDETLTRTATTGVLVNDRDGDGDLLNISRVVTEPNNGTLSLNADGSFTYQPNANFNGIDFFSYEATDGNGSFSEATVAINVLPVDEPPEAVNDTFTVNEDNSVTIDVLANDVDFDGEGIQITAINGQAISTNDSVNIANGVITLNTDNTLLFTPTANFNGPISFEYTIEDRRQAATATVTGTVIAVNDAPVIIIDDVDATENTSFTINPLANATDVDGDTLTVTSASAEVGSIIINSDGTITYIPEKDYVGSDTITFTVSDGNGGFVTKTLSVSVQAEPQLIQGASVRPNLAAPNRELITRQATVGIDFSTTNYVIDAAALNRPGVTRPDGGSETYVIDTAQNNGIPYYDYNELHVINAATNTADFADRRYQIKTEPVEQEEPAAEEFAENAQQVTTNAANLLRALALQSEQIAYNSPPTNLGKLTLNQQLQQHIASDDSLTALTKALQSTEKQT